MCSHFKISIEASSIIYSKGMKIYVGSRSDGFFPSFHHHYSLLFEKVGGVGIGIFSGGVYKLWIRLACMWMWVPWHASINTLRAVLFVLEICNLTIFFYFCRVN